MIGKLLTDMLLDIIGDRLEGYGKASVVGMGGEIEHARCRRLHNHHSIDAPRTMAGFISHYQTIQTSICRRSAEDEIIIALGASVGGHPNHRIEDRYEDLREMGHDADNPADV